MTKKTVDHSDSGNFSFSFFCDLCGQEWVSQVKPFSGGRCSVTENDEAKKLLWANEHRALFDEANLEAHMHFCRCTKCGNWVCEECFLTEEEICKKCK